MNGKKILFDGSSETAKIGFKEMSDKVIEIDNNIDNYYVRGLNLWAIYRVYLLNYIEKGISKNINKKNKQKKEII